MNYNFVKIYHFANKPKKKFNKEREECMWRNTKWASGVGGGGGEARD